jgi:DNA-binding response OmpR family regulator
MKTRILIVDDEALLLEVLEAVFVEAGYEVQCAANGVQGLRAFQQGNWDLVITDRAMPLINGENLARAIKSISPKTPLVMMTGFVEAISCKELFARIVAKPFQPGDLVAEVSRILAPNGTRGEFAAAPPTCAT